MVSNKMVISEWYIGDYIEEIGRGLILRYYPGICLEELRKTMEILSRNSRSRGRELYGIISAMLTVSLPTLLLIQDRPDELAHLLSSIRICFISSFP
jgi:hypothetical protein